MIKENMRFIDFVDFYNRKDTIASSYWDLGYYDKVVYKYYVYSRRHIRERLCDAIWEYLNAETIEELSDANMRLTQGYNRSQAGGK